MNGTDGTPRGVTPLQHLRTPLAFGFTNAATWMVALGTPLVLLAGQLGASSLQVGLLHSFVFLLLPMQVLATTGLARFGFKRQMLFAWAGRSVFLLIPLFLTLKAPGDPQPWMVNALVAAVFFFCFFRTLGSCAFMPWMYHLIPDGLRGRYFATDQLLAGVSGILTLIYCAALFRYLTPYQAFFWQYLLALIASMAALVIISRIPAAPNPRVTSLREILATAPRISLRKGSFRQYLGFMLTSAVIVNALPPFTAYYLKVEAGISLERIMVYSAFLFTGSITGAWFLRSRLDGVGVKPIFRLAILLQVIIFTFWIGYTAGFGGWGRLLPAAFFLFGVAMCLWNSAHLKYLPRVCPQSNQALAISIYAAVVGFIGGISPILWGWFFRDPGPRAGIDPMRFYIYLCVAAGLLLTLFTRVNSLTSQHSERPPLEVGGFVLKPLRFLGQLIHLPALNHTPPTTVKPASTVKPDEPGGG